MNVRALSMNVLLVVVSILLGLGLGEIATRVFAPQLMSGTWIVVGPLGAYLNKASGTAVHEMLDRAVTYEFNSKHHRSELEPNPKARKVLVLGDSFTFGIGLAIEETFVEKLQREIDRQFGDDTIQLLNAGVTGSGTADQLAYLEAFGDSLDLSAVVVMVSFDDFRRAIQRGIYKVASGERELDVVDLTSSARSRIKRLQEGSRFYEFLLRHSQLVQLLRKAVVLGWFVAVTEPGEGRAEKEVEAERRLARLLFRRMAAWCAQRNVQFTVLTTGWPLVDYPWLGKVLRGEDIVYFDLKSGVAGIVGHDLPRYIILGDPHPNELGATVIKDAAWPIMRDRLRELPPRTTSSPTRWRAVGASVLTPVDDLTRECLGLVASLSGLFDRIAELRGTIRA